MLQLLNVSLNVSHISVHNSAVANGVTVAGSCSLRPIKELNLQEGTVDSKMTPLTMHGSEQAPELPLSFLSVDQFVFIRDGGSGRNQKYNPCDQKIAKLQCSHV